MKAIINIFNNITTYPTNINGPMPIQAAVLETIYLCKKFNLDCIGKKNKNNKHIENYVDISDIIDLDIYQKIL